MRQFDKAKLQKVNWEFSHIQQEVKKATTS